MTMKQRVLAIVIALFGTSAASASAQDEWPAHIALNTIYGGSELAFDGRWAAVEIMVENRTARNLSGVVVLRIPYGASMRREVRMDVPARDSRRAIVPMYMSSGVEARFLVDGVPVSELTSLSVTYGSESGGVVLLGEGTRLRGGLLDLRAYDRPSYDPYATDLALSEVIVAVGTVSFDPSTGDPRLPDDAIAYSGVRLVVAHVPSLRLASERQRAALTDWVTSGGRLLIFPRTSQDLSDAFVHELVGDMTVDEARTQLPPLVPADVARVELRCGPSQVDETFGCSRTRGFGRVFVASYDGMSDTAVDSGVTRELIRSIYAPGDDARALLRYGGGNDHPSEEWSEHAFTTLRAALDPNESFRGGLLLVALVLLVYVIVVGPLNFRWVQSRNAPVLALLTTPMIAGACVALLIGVGYLGKGISMRHRRVEIIELMEGATEGHARRYTGYYVTRPGGFDLPALEPSVVARRLGETDANGPVQRDRPDGVTLEEFRAGLWETAFVREDRVVGVNGGITFGRDGQRIATVENHTGVAIEGAVIVDGQGQVYVLGNIPAGGQKSVPQYAVGSLPTYGIGIEDDPSNRLAMWMDLHGDHELLLKGVMRLFEPGFISPAPVFYGWLATTPTDVPPFNAEVDRRFIRVVPRVESLAILPSDPIESERGYPTEEEDYSEEVFETGPPDPLVEQLLNAGRLDGGVAPEVSVDGGAP